MFRLHGPITEKTAISNLNTFFMHCHFVTKNLCTLIRQYTAVLLYVILLYVQKCVTGNIMKNSKAYCLISACSCYVIISKAYIF